MKKRNILTFNLFFCLVIVVVILPGTTQNPTPVVGLKEKLRIQDDEGDFYFKYPASPVVDEQGFIFVEDQDQLLMFSPKGTFLRNFFKKGQGPGELTYICGITFEKENIIVCNRHPHKLLWFDRKGNLQKEVRISDKLGYSHLLSLYEGRFYFLREKFVNTKNKAVFLDINVVLLSTGINDKEAKFENLWFPKKYFVVNTNYIQNVHYVQIAKADAHTAFIANDGNYDIKHLDLKKMALSPFINKKYKKVKIKQTWRKVLKPTRFPHYDVAGKTYKEFVRETIDDVQRIWANGDKLWILTSTFDEETRLVRTDVYDRDGNYRGTLRLNMPEGIHLFQMSYANMTIHKERLYIFETSIEGEIDLACYDLLNIPAWAR